MSAAAIRAGAAYIELTLRDRFSKGLSDASKKLGKFGKSISSIGTRVLALGTAIAAPLMAASQQFAAFGDQVAKMAARTGMSTEAVSGLGFAAEQSGADLATLEKGVQKMQRTVDAAANGSQMAAEALGRIGLSAADLAGMAPEDALARIADGLSGVADPSTKAAIAMDIFGKSGTKLIPLLNGGSAGMAALRKQAEELGIVMDGETAKQAERLTDAMNELKRAMHAAFVNGGSAIAPVLSEMSSWLAKGAAEVGKFMRENKALIGVALKVGAAIMAGGLALLVIGKTIGLAAAALSVLATASGIAATAVSVLGGVLAAIASPIGLVVAGAAALGLSLAYAGESGGVALQWLADAFGGLRDDALAAWGGIANALMAGDIAKAGEILWLELKLVWQKGINTVYGLWLTAVNFIQTSWIDAWALIETTFTDVFAYFSTYLNDFLASFQKGWGDATDWLAKRLLWLWGQFDATLDVAGAQREVDEAGARRNRGIDERTAEWRRDPEGMRQKRNAEIEAERQAAQAARQAAFETNIIAGDAEVQARREAVQASIDEANNAAPQGQDGKPMPSVDFPSIGNAIASDAGKLESKGTFNALAAGLMGSDSLAERQAKAAETTAENTRRLLQEAKRGGIVFAE